MATKIQLSRAEADELYQGFAHFFPDDRAFINSSFLRWKDRAQFIKEIKDTTDIDISSGNPKLIKNSQEVLESFVVAEKTEANLPTEALREQQEAERKARQNAIKESAAKAKQQVEDRIQKEKALHEKTKGKHIYRKVNTPEPETLSAAKEQTRETFKKAAENNPAKFTKHIADEIENRITPTIPDGADKAAVKALATQSAARITQNLRGESFAVEAVTANQLWAQKDLANQVLSDDGADFLNSAANVGTTQILEYQIGRRLVSSAFGEDFADNFYGPRDIDKVTAQFSTTPQEGYEEYDLGKITGQNVDFLEHQDFIFGSIRDLGVDQVKANFLRQVGTWVESQIPTEGIVAEAFNAPVVQAAYSYFGLGEPVAWEATTWFGRLAIETNLGPAFGYFGEFTGVSTGVTRAVASIGAEVGADAAAGAAVTTHTLALGAESAAVTAAAGVGTAGAEAAVAGTALAVGTEAAVAGGVTAGGAAAAGAGAGLLTGPAAVVAVPVLATVGAIAGPKLINLAKDLIRKSKNIIIAGTGGAFGAVVGSVAGVGILTGGIVGAASALGISAFLSGGLAGVQSALSSAFSGITAAFGVIFGTFMAGVAGPIVAALIGIPILVAFVFLVINSGAYVVPPGLSSITSTNPYISVEKKASPGGQLSSPTSITYTVTIVAKKDPLKGINIEAECTATKKGSTLKCPPEDIPEPPESISPGAPFSFSFTVDYGSQFQDSLVSDTITVTAFSDTGGEITESGSASVCFGECPLECFAFPDEYWPANSEVQKLKSLLTGAASTLAGKYPDFAAKVCKGGTVNLCFKPSIMPAGIFGWHEHGGQCDIDFNSRVTPYGDEGVLFLLTHEVGHHIQNISPGYFSQYMDQVNPPKSEGYVCTRGANDPYESMAEAAALFVASPVIDANRACLTKSFQSQYPKHYQYVKNVLFAP